MRRVSVGSIIHVGICLAADLQEGEAGRGGEAEEGAAQPVDCLTLGAFCGRARKTTNVSAATEASDLLRERRMDAGEGIIPGYQHPNTPTPLL